MDNSSNLFISWSKERSKWVARALREWLPTVIQSVQPWMSDSDIDAGSRSLPEIAEALAGAKVGISCLTPENLNSPWILFEAGALSKTIDDKTRLCTYLLGGLQPEDVQPPLGVFHAMRADKESTRKLVNSINRALNDPAIPESRVDTLFDATWPILEKQLNEMPEPEEAIVATRPQGEMIAEILEISRSEANKRKKVDALDAFLPIFEDLVPILPQIREALRGLRFRTTPELPSLPTLPSTYYPEWTTVRLTTNGKLYRNVSGSWQPG